MKRVKTLLVIGFAPCLTLIPLTASAQDQAELKRVVCAAHPTDSGCPGYVAPPPDNADAVMSVQAHYDNTNGHFVDFSWQAGGFRTEQECRAYTESEFDKEDARSAQDSSRPRPQRYGESVLNYPNGTIWYGCILKSLLNSAALARYVKVNMDLKTAQSMKMVPFSTFIAPPVPSNRGLPYRSNTGGR